MTSFKWEAGFGGTIEEETSSETPAEETPPTEEVPPSEPA
jgi:hypothetical protein